MTEKEIKGSLLEQLRLQNKTSEFYQDLAGDYIQLWKLKKKLLADIR